MKKFFMFFATIIMMVVAAVSCGKYEDQMLAEKTEKPAEPTSTPDAKLLETVVFSSKHVAFEREASMTADSVAQVLCGNVVVLRELYNDNTKREFTLSYKAENLFRVNAPKSMIFKSLDAKIGQTYTFAGESCDVDGFVFSVSFVSNQVLGPVMHKEQDFASQLHACSIKPQTLTITALNTVVIRFWDNEQTDFAELKLTVLMSESDKQVDFDHTKWSYNHLNFVREASLTNGVINVFCNNVADFVDIYTNGSTKNAEQIDYRVVNTFSFAAPTIEVKDINSVIGKTFNFVEGVATVEGYFVTVNWQSAKLIDKVMHNNSDYTSQINACKVAVRTITFVSAASAVIRFYEDNSNDYAELTAAVKVTESEKPVTFERTDWNYKHISWVRNANVSGNNITVVCNNTADFVDIYSDGSKRNQESVAYNCNNIFTYNAPAMEVENVNSVIGKTYNFVNGVANIEGYNVRVNWNSAKVAGNVMHNSKNYANEITPCKATAKTLTITSNSTAVVRFYDNNSNDYAEATIVISLKETEKPVETPTFVTVEWTYGHVSYVREATMANGAVTVVCNNNANFRDLYSDGSYKNEETVAYRCNNYFTFNAPAMEVKSLNTVVGKTYSFVNGVASVEGYNVRMAWTSAQVVDKVMHNAKNYASEIHACQLSARTLTVTSATSGIIRFYKDDASDYAELRVSLSIKEEETPIVFERTDWNYKHISWVRNATVSGNNITVVCNNTADFVDIYSDGSRRNQESVAYNCNNIFTYNAPAMEVENVNSVIGKTYNFVNGVATVEGYAVRVNWASAKVAGNVMHNSKNYANEITPCKAIAKTLTITSSSTAVVRFYDNNSNDFAEAQISISLKETVRLVEVARTYVHDTFRSNAVVNGTNIAVICDNHANFVKKYSNGTQDAAVKVAYTVTNNFSVSTLEFTVESKSEIVGKTYNFNNGVTTIAGKTVNVTFSNRKVSDVMFEGNNYKNEAPACAAEVKTIRINDGSAIISFEEDGEVITAIVPCTVTETEKPSVLGKIICGFATDSYHVGSQGVSVREGTYIHILAEYNGVYTIYSKRVGADEWGKKTVVSADAAAKRPFAFITDAMDTVGYISTAKEYESGSYVIVYNDFSGNVYRTIGKTSATISGQPNRNPIRGTWSNGSITVDGQTYTIVGSQK